ncbi:MAG: FeoB small GTPase domain-containing protein, partial [Cyanobacteriota bacterium]
LVGLPNTGKSTLFNALTGGHAQIANWPGLTMELEWGPLPADARGQPYALVDLPGLHDLSGSSEDEAIVQRFLRHTPPDAVLVVLNASQISGQLRLLLQLRALGLPLVAALNMSDEAQRFGITIDHGGLGEALGLPVVPVSAKKRQGMGELLRHLHRQGKTRGEVGDPVPRPQEELDALQQDLVARFVTLPAEGLRHRRSRAVDRVLLHPSAGSVGRPFGWGAGKVVGTGPGQPGGAAPAEEFPARRDLVGGGNGGDLHAPDFSLLCVDWHH